MTLFGVKISGLIRGERCDLRLRAFWAWVAMAMCSETLVQVSPALPGFERKMSILLQAVERCNLLWKCLLYRLCFSSCHKSVQELRQERVRGSSGYSCQRGGGEGFTIQFVQRQHRFHLHPNSCQAPRMVCPIVGAENFSIQFHHEEVQCGST